LRFVSPYQKFAIEKFEEDTLCPIGP